MRLFLATFLGCIGARDFRAEAESALQLARSAQLNPHELVYLGGAYARFGDTASSLNVLHSMVDGGRLPGRLFLTLVAPSLRNAKGWQKLLDAYDTEEKRRRRLYGAS